VSSNGARRTAAAIVGEHSGERTVVRRARARVAIATLLLLTGFSAIAVAQTPPKMPRIGYISPGASSNPARVARLDAFRRSLREHGYVEGQNIVVESRWARGNYDRYAEIVAELVRSKVDVLVTVGGAGSQAAQRATKTIPIVMTVVNDPLGSGLVESLARPGGNLTGLSMMAPDLVGKQLQVLTEIVPKLSRVALLSNPDSPGSAPQVRGAESVAPTLGLRLQVLEARTVHEIDQAFAVLGKERPGALVVLAESIFTNQAKQIADLAVTLRLPTIFGLKEHADAGGLVVYGADPLDMERRAAGFVVKILNGARPADLPVEQPSKLELIINMKTAKALGLTIPQSVLLRADQVLE
jgi:putative ABC transport system substrate-binding protein